MLYRQNFALVYLKLSFPRLPALEQGRLVSSLVQSLEGHTQQQQSGYSACVPLHSTVKPAVSKDHLPIKTARLCPNSACTIIDFNLCKETT